MIQICIFGRLTTGDLEVGGFKNGYLAINCCATLMYSSPVGHFLYVNILAATLEKNCRFASLLIAPDVNPISTSARKFVGKGNGSGSGSSLMISFLTASGRGKLVVFLVLHLLLHQSHLGYIHRFLVSWLSLALLTLSLDPHQSFRQDLRMTVNVI